MIINNIFDVSILECIQFPSISESMLYNLDTESVLTHMRFFYHLNKIFMDPSICTCRMFLVQLFFYQKVFTIYNYIIMGTQRRNYKHGDQKHLHRSIMAITSAPIYLKHKKILFYQYIIYKYLINKSMK